MNRLDQKYVFGGIDQQIDDTLQDKNKTKDQANSRILPMYSILSKRKGVRKYNSQVIWGGKYVRGLFEYFSGTTRRIFALIGTDIFYDTNNGTFVKAGLTLSDASDHLLSGVSYKGRAYMANNHNAMITYNGTTFGNAGLPVPVVSGVTYVLSQGFLPIGTYGYKVTYLYDGYQETDGSTAIPITSTGVFAEDSCNVLGNWVTWTGDVTLSNPYDVSIGHNVLHAVIGAGFTPNNNICYKTPLVNISFTKILSLRIRLKVSTNVGDEILYINIKNAAGTILEHLNVGIIGDSNWHTYNLYLANPLDDISLTEFGIFIADNTLNSGTIDIADIDYLSVTSQITLNNIPTSADPRVTARKIYRTIIGGSVYYLLTTIANNTTTTYSDDVLDEDLGTEVPPISISNGLTYIKDLVLLQDRLFAISTLQGATSSMVCSTSGEPDNFPAAFDPDDSAGGGPLEIAKDDGDELMRLFGMEDWLYCFKKNYIYKVYVKGDPLTSWEIRILHNVGSTSYFGVVKGENDFYFYHTTGIYHIVDYSIEKISEPIRDFIKNISSAMSNNVALCIDRTRKKLLVAFCDPYISPTSVNNSMAVYDLVTKEWESIDNDIYIKSFMEKDDGTILYGDYIDGFIKKLNQYEDDVNFEKSIANIDNETWAGGAADATNYKDGLKGLKITATTSSTATGATSFATAISLTSWSNGDLSDDEDFIDFWLYHTTRANITSIVLDIDVNDGGYTDKYTYTVLAAALTSGDNAWTKIHVKKSAFTRTGSTSGKDWATVKDMTFTVTANSNGSAVVTVDDIRMVADQRKLISTHYTTKAISPVSAETDHHFVDLYLECRKFVDSDLIVKYDIEHGKKVKELTLWTAKNKYLGITDNTNTRVVVRRKNDLVYTSLYSSASGLFRAICADDDKYYVVNANQITIIDIPTVIITDNLFNVNVNDFLYTHTDTVIYTIGMTEIEVGTGTTGEFEYTVNFPDVTSGPAVLTQPLLFVPQAGMGATYNNGYFVGVYINPYKTTPEWNIMVWRIGDPMIGLVFTGSTFVLGTDQVIKVTYDSSDTTLTTFKIYVDNVLHIDYDFKISAFGGMFGEGVNRAGTVVNTLIAESSMYATNTTVGTDTRSRYFGQAGATETFDYFWSDIIATLPSITGAEGISCDVDYLYVSDYAGDRINIYNKIEPITLQATFGTTGDGDDEFSGPCGICCDDLYLYIVDMGNNRIKKHLKASPYTFVASYGRAGSGQSRSYGVGNYELKSPFGICVDHTHLWITDGGNYRIMKIRKDLADDCFVAKVGGYGVSGNDAFNLPRGIAVDDNYIYIVDGGNNLVQKREKELMVFVEAYGSSGSGNDQLNNPYDVAINDLDYTDPDRVHTNINIERVGKCISLNFKQEEVGQNMEIMAINLSYKPMKVKGR